MEEVKEKGVVEEVKKKKKTKKVMVEVPRVEEQKPVDEIDWIDNPEKWDVVRQN